MSKERESYLRLGSLKYGGRAWALLSSMELRTLETQLINDIETGTKHAQEMAAIEAFHQGDIKFLTEHETLLNQLQAAEITLRALRAYTEWREQLL